MRMDFEMPTLIAMDSGRASSGAGAGQFSGASASRRPTAPPVTGPSPPAGPPTNPPPNPEKPGPNVVWAPVTQQTSRMVSSNLVQTAAYPPPAVAVQPLNSNLLLLLLLLFLVSAVLLGVHVWTTRKHKPVKACGARSYHLPHRE